MHFAGLDYLILIVYFCSLATVGYIFGRREQNTEDFFLGGRRIPWLAVCFSILATELSALTFIGVPADSFRADHAYLQFAFGSLLGRIGIAMLFMPAFYGGRVTTVYEYLAQRFGAGTRNTATLFFFVTRLLASGVRLFGASIAVSVVTGWPIIPCIGIMALFAMAYTGLGGIKAVVWTDVLQITVFLGGAIVAAIYLLTRIPGGWEGVVQVAGPLGKLRVFDLSINLSDPRILLVGLVNGCVGTFAALGADQDLAQRMLTTKKAREAQKSVILTGILDFPIVMLFLTIGSLLFVFYHLFPDPNIPAQTDRIFPYFIMTQLPVGLRGLLIAGVLAAAMSSTDSALGALSSSAVVDIYKPYIKQKASERHYLKVSRWFVVLFAAFLVSIAIASRNVEGVLWLGLKIGSFTYGALLAIFLLGTLVKRGSNLGNIIAMFSSVPVTLIIYSLESRLHISWPWITVIGMLWTFFWGYVLDGMGKDRRREAVSSRQ
ncbi:sodium:solute symporter [Candidatus Zixiibacteriota bacterium]